MNERTLWSSHIKPRWHHPAEGRVAWKVEDKYFSGAPDADCCFNGVVAKIELKYDERWPARDDTPCWFSFLDKTKAHKSLVSALQYNWLDQWRSAGGNAFVLLIVGKQWLLLEQGLYENVPQAKESLMEASVLVHLIQQPTSWNSLSLIPPFIEEHYGRR